jgi:glycosyltransferase involved in cell wall biosynthesis
MANFQVIAGSPYWALNGVNIFSANLVRGLIARGAPARILMTERNTRMVDIGEPLMPLPTDIPVDDLPLRGAESWGAHWGATIRYLEEHAPCVYIPNHDWRHSNVCSRLSSAVRVVGVVHSDDPLHYDHVARLGRYWDGIVTTTAAIAQVVISRNPGLANRVCTIPIGVPVPQTSSRRNNSSGKLRLVYQGGLIQYQKRVFDLPKIVEEALRRGIPVELSVIGDGAERDALKDLSRRMVDAGAMRFLGIVPHDRLMELLGEFDVFLLTSEFEGMPNALGEAMAHGCIPIVTDIRSGVKELVHHGESGFRAPVGDISAFADYLAALHQDPAGRATMAARAREAVIAGGFSVDTMVERYEALFRDLFAGPRSRFHRPKATLRMPPYQVERVKLFDVRHVEWFDHIGALPTGMPDLHGYVHESGDAQPGACEPFHLMASRPYPNVVVSATSGRISGVDVFSAGLVRGLRSLGRGAHVLMTSPDDITPDPLAFPDDIPVRKLRVSRWTPWTKRWQCLSEYLEDNAPCVYIPNYDWNYSGISPTLSPKVAIVGIVHSDDPVHYEHVSRLGRYWNAIVAVSGVISERVAAIDPSFAPRLVTIPYGVESPASPPLRPPDPHSPLRIVYAGRLVQEQKRVLEIPKIFGALLSRGTPAQLTFIGAGQDERTLRQACEPWIRAGHVSFLGALPNAEVRRKFAESDVLLLTSEFEGLPVSLLEAMSEGCVPVVTDIPSGIPEVIRNGDTGYRVALGDIDGFAERLSKLHADPGLRQRLATNCWQAVRTRYSQHNMVSAYLGLFERVLVEAEVGEFQRPCAEILPPPGAWLTRRPRGLPGAGLLRFGLSAARQQVGWNQ